MIRTFLISIFGIFPSFVAGQITPQSIQTSFVLQKSREAMNHQLMEWTIKKSLSLELNQETQFRYESSFWSITQFMIYDSTVYKAFKTTLGYYDSLNTETRRSFLEAAYTIRPRSFTDAISKLLQKEHDPRNFTMIALYIWRENPDRLTAKRITDLLNQSFTNPELNDYLTNLLNYINKRGPNAPQALPDLAQLFAYQQKLGGKRIYSFQRKNRDFTGLAAVQLEDGHFARDENKKLILIPQLARAASNLPYFVTNGNTPQGIYRILGTGKTANKLIGPTPNLQMIMPNEVSWSDFLLPGMDSSNTIQAYLQLLPESWRRYEPIKEAFLAGKAGRTEIIAHGTTIDPEYFKGKSFYPISPTLGCLCAAETWDTQTGRLVNSNQLKLINTFLQSPDTTGYFFVINISDDPNPVSADEIETLVSYFESRLPD